MTSAKTMDYGYDDLNRLTSATSTDAVYGSNFLQTYGYNDIGNIVTRSDTGDYSYSSTGKTNPDAVTQIGTTGYVYDDTGNMTAAGYTDFTWDYKNRLTQVSSATGTSTYAYDPDGNRVSLTSGGTTTYFPSNSYEVTSGTPTKHIYAGDILVADVVGSGSSTTVRYVHTDHLTGSAVLTSATGTLDETIDYYPYGNLRLDEQTAGYSERKKFAGHDFDTDTGLSYMGARYYDSTIGRFYSEDPVFLNIGDAKQLSALLGWSNIAKSGTQQNDHASPKENGDQIQRLQTLLSDPQNLNAYAYARNSPINNIDVSGLIGVGYTAGGTAEAGDVIAGAAVTASSGGGFFWGPSTGSSHGSFATVGGFANSSNCSGLCHYGPANGNWVIGAYTGAGPSVFITNANTVSDLKGTSKTLSINLPSFILKGLSIQISLDRNDSGRYIGMVTIGVPSSPAVGTSISWYSSSTKPITKDTKQQQ